MPGVSADERDMLVESRPEIFYFTDHYRDYPMLLIRLSKAKRAMIEPLLPPMAVAGLKGSRQDVRSEIVAVAL